MMKARFLCVIALLLGVLVSQGAADCSVADKVQVTLLVQPSASKDTELTKQRLDWLVSYLNEEQSQRFGRNANIVKAYWASYAPKGICPELNALTGANDAVASEALTPPSTALPGNFSAINFVYEKIIATPKSTNNLVQVLVLLPNDGKLADKFRRSDCLKPGVQEIPAIARYAQENNVHFVIAAKDVSKFDYVVPVGASQYYYPLQLTGDDARGCARALGDMIHTAACSALGEPEFDSTGGTPVAVITGASIAGVAALGGISFGAYKWATRKVPPPPRKPSAEFVDTEGLEAAQLEKEQIIENENTLYR